MLWICCIARVLNLNVDGMGHRWFILKPGFADRAQGIRMFSTEDELSILPENLSLLPLMNQLDERSFGASSRLRRPRTPTTKTTT